MPQPENAPYSPASYAKACEILGESVCRSLGLFVILGTDVDLRPDAAHQEPVVLPHVLLRDVDVLVAKIHELGPVLVVVREVADFDLVDQRVLALVFYLGLHGVGFVRSHKVLGESRVDDSHPGFDGHGLIGRAILPQQVLKDEDRDVGPHLHLADQILTDDLTRKHGCRFSI